MLVIPITSQAFPRLDFLCFQFIHFGNKRATDLTQAQARNTPCNAPCDPCPKATRHLRAAEHIASREWFHGRNNLPLQMPRQLRDARLEANAAGSAQSPIGRA
ncbi:hypothetical protein RSPO_c01122 [Ralstonia solanacearum Po82]|uniref:Uncharacterized protein n=1 Tax=Ralstonia solanacearum (strain Po82) TaxID=1031711 RepID=F6FZR1_RALS8|nr:hypothetical protein RSPO_c01122 [Ralstonia solanacearum Po82]